MAAYHPTVVKSMLQRHTAHLSLCVYRSASAARTVTESKGPCMILRLDCLSVFLWVLLHLQVIWVSHLVGSTE